MSSGFFAPSGQDFDDLFELQSEFPGLANVDIGFNTEFFAGTQDLRNRYIRRFDSTKVPDVEMRMDKPYVPPTTGTCFYESELDQWFCIEFPAIPARQFDLSELFSPKGRIDGFFRFPFCGPVANQTHTTNESVPESFSGNVTRTVEFGIYLSGGVYDTALTVTEIIITSSSGAGSHSFTSSVITLPSSDPVFRYRRLSVVVPVTTFIAAGANAASNTATRTITFRTRASNGRYSNTSGTTHPTADRTRTFTCSHTLTLTRQGGGFDPDL